MAVSREGKILYANRVLEEATGLGVGVTTQEMVSTFRASDFDGRPMDLASLPVSLVLRGETLQGVLLRLHPPGGTTEVILSVNGCPARDVLGRVVAAIIVARPVSEEMAMAMAVRNLAGAKRAEEVAPVG
jgi:PAS domain-containing protein